MSEIMGRTDVAVHFGMEPDAPWHQIEKAVYEGTDCGAWIECTDVELRVGSIVEGSDVDCQTHILMLPTTSKALSEALDAIELEAPEIWNEWNDETDEVRR